MDSSSSTRPLRWVPTAGGDVVVPARRLDETRFETINQKGQARIVEVKDAATADGLAIVHPSALQQLDNLVELEELNEAALLETLRSRYLLSDKIYTRCSTVLISINPYKQIPGLYTHERRVATRQLLDEAGDDPSTLPPHPYVLAHAAYRAMLDDKRNQAVVISGESGSGKTEATKIVLSYLAFLSVLRSGRGNSPSAHAHAIEKRLIEANPVIEALGNAKTLRNNNSSRFGKLIDVHFVAGEIVGGSITHYLLEKSRVTNHSYGEASYHIFYMFLRALRENRVADARLPHDVVSMDCEPTSYQYLGEDEDDSGLDATLHGMACLEFDDETMHQLWRTVAAVLVLGNVQFDPDDDGHAHLDLDQQSVVDVSRLLQLPREELKMALCGRQSNFRKSSIVYIPFTVAQAEAVRDAAARHMYSVLFDHVMGLVNDRLGDAAHRQSDHSVSIGVLDIFGFEVFEVNQLEQLFINYANEHLQRHFNRYVFELELAEYAKEELTMENVQYEDNSACIELLERPPRGVLPMLDEELIIPNGSESNLLQRLHSEHGEGARASKHYEKPRFGGMQSFVIRHYAGPVEYKMEDFLTKNREKLETDMANLLANRSHTFPFFANLSPDKDGDGDGDGDGGGASEGKHQHQRQHTAIAFAQQQHERQQQQRQQQRRRRALTRSFSSSSSMHERQGTTLASTFRVQLKELMDTIDASAPHFIRCVKPNSFQKADAFEADSVLEQLRYSGIEAAVRIRKLGLPIRIHHTEFVGRYRPLCAAVTPPHRSIAFPVRKTAEQLAAEEERKKLAAIDDADLPPHLAWKRQLARARAASKAEAAKKKTAEEEEGEDAPRKMKEIDEEVDVADDMKKEPSKVVVARMLDALHERLALGPTDFAVGVSRVFISEEKFGILDRLAQQARRRAAVIIQCAWRVHAARKEASARRFMRKLQSATRIQTAWRGFTARRQHQQLVREHTAARVLQQAWRRCDTARRLRERKRREDRMLASPNAVMLTIGEDDDGDSGDDGAVFVRADKPWPERAFRAWQWYNKAVMERCYLRFWVMFVFLLFNFLIVLILLSFLSHSIFLLCDRERAKEDDFGVVVVSSLSFALITLLFAPDLIYAVNKLRVDAFSRVPVWFPMIHKRLLKGFIGDRLCAGRFPVVSRWARSHESVHDVFTTWMFSVPILYGIGIGTHRESMVFFVSAFVQFSIAGGLGVALAYLAYRFWRKFSRKNAEWLMYFVRFIGCQRRSYAPNTEVMVRTYIATAVFCIVTFFAFFSIVSTFSVVGAPQGLVFLAYFLIAWPAICYNLHNYISFMHGDQHADRQENEVFMDDDDDDMEGKDEEEEEESKPVPPGHARSSSHSGGVNEFNNRKKKRADEEDKEEEEAEKKEEGKAPVVLRSVADVLLLSKSMKRQRRKRMKDRIYLRCLNALHFHHCKVFFGLLLFFLFFLLLVYPRDDAESGTELNVNAPGAAVVFNTSKPIAGAPEYWQYGICSEDWRRLTIIDLALFSQLAYTPSVDFSTLFGHYFNSSEWVLRGKNDPTDAVRFYDFFSAQHNLSVVAVRGTASSQDAAADAVLLMDVAILQLCPLVTVLPERVIRNIVNAVSFSDWLLFPSSRLYYSPLVDYVRKARSSRDVIMTGHSLGGFLAKFVGVSENTTAVTFAAPGLSWSLDKFDLDGKNLERVAVTVKAHRDVVPQVGKLAGLVQGIECDRTAVECHVLTHYVCELLANCGDKRGRSFLEDQCDAWHKHDKKL